MNLKVASLNVNGFRSKVTQHLVKDFATKNHIDIMLLQETYIDNASLAKSIEQDFKTERLDFIQNLSQHLCGAKNLILGGDFNFIFDSNLDKLGGNLEKGTVGSKAFKSVMDKFSLIDCFRHLHPRKRAVTWMRKNVHNFEMIGTRLDRFYALSILKEHLINFDTIPCSRSDHDYIVMNLGRDIETGTSFGNSYWKFNDSLLDDSDFVSAFELLWKFTSYTDSISLPWWDCMKENFKTFCTDYSKSKNKHILAN